MSTQLNLEPIFPLHHFWIVQSSKVGNQLMLRVFRWQWKRSSSSWIPHQSTDKVSSFLQTSLIFAWVRRAGEDTMDDASLALASSLLWTLKESSVGLPSQALLKCEDASSKTYKGTQGVETHSSFPSRKLYRNCKDYNSQFQSRKNDINPQDPFASKFLL